MNKLKELINKFYNPYVIEAGRIFFYLGLLFEVVIFALDRADWINPYQSYMFRVTFVLFVIKCICTRYDKKQIAFIIGVAAISITTYLICGKDDVVRAAVFIIAMKDIDLKRSLRFDYFTMSFSIALLGLLSIFGVLGEVMATPGYEEKEHAFMLAFGLGSSNTLAIQIWVLVALALYLYYDRMPKWMYAVIASGGILVYALTKTNTALIMFMFTAGCGFILTICPKLQKSRITYLFGAIIVLLVTAFSVFAAKISKWWDYQPDWQRKLDTILTGRITSLYAFENGGAVLSNWKLFGSKQFWQPFDMGIVRLFWWYGIIPGSLAILAVLFLIYRLYKRSDYMGLVLVVSMMIFSLFEAHFISSFICRSYLLFMFGYEWYHVVFVPDDKRKIRLAFYLSSLTKGGAERVFCNLATYFIGQGYDVTIITQYKKENEYDLPDGARRIISDITPEESKGRIYNVLARFFKMHRILVRLDADILMTTIGKNNFMAITATAFIPTRSVVSIVADPKEEYTTGGMRLLMQLLFPEADGIIMQTKQSLEFYKLGLAKKCIILPNSVSTDFIKDRFEGQRPKDIYIVGRMDSNKNQEMAIRAYASIIKSDPSNINYSSSHMYILGDGELRSYLEDLTVKLCIQDHVVFTGPVNDVHKRLEKAYMFILTSNSEGMPNTLLEAMSLGTACISTDCPCGGPRDLISTGKNGILVPVGDTEALSSEIKRLLDDPILTENLGKEAYFRMLEYRPENVNAKWKSFFENSVLKIS